MKTQLTLVLFLVACKTALADLDWGGGATRFLDDGGIPLNAENGLAVLVATSGGGSIQFATLGLQERFSLVSPGVVISQGTQTHRIVSLSNAFVSGYLLNTLVDDLTADQQVALGVGSGHRLSLVVWDRSTFNAGIPTGESRYTMIPLYVAGATSLPSEAFGRLLPDPMEVIYPSRTVDSTRVDSDAVFANPFTLQVQPGQTIQFVFPGSNPEGDALEFSASRRE
jgi:hypothetical protein